MTQETCDTGDTRIRGKLVEAGILDFYEGFISGDTVTRPGACN